MAKRSAAASEDAGPVEAADPAWLSPKAAARHIGISVSTFYETVMHQVDTHKLGNRSLIKRASLDKFMASLPAQPRKGLRLRHRKGNAV